ncbi:hypothetical protein E2N92_07315 [Methanofollis formosanus]|uniref:Uncharacterized protein n=1 Tax=Methanofollis formosanus TaxID=299308 RepID=A0A8G1EFY2_9EURY|nr:hypothetical protein [Methanofollis formosanus]QYZ79258.1 hypothetical protein E2N92_07315 [Methanofollis formosanus]
MFDDLFGDTIGAINRWTPEKNYRKEDGYRDDLIQYLRERLNQESPFSNRKVTIQPESGRSLCDIVVDRSIGIELKKDLKEKAKVDRALGQLHRYWGQYHDIIIVLVGNTDPNKYDDLREQISDFVDRNGDYSFNPKKIRVIDKTPKNRKKRTKTSQNRTQMGSSKKRSKR